jgi:hypothetical protein
VRRRAVVDDHHSKSENVCAITESSASAMYAFTP